MKWAWGPSERVKIALVQHLLFLQHPLPLVIPTWTSCHAALDKAALCAFLPREGGCGLPTPPSSTGNPGERSRGTCGSADPSWECFSTNLSAVEGPGLQKRIPNEKCTSDRIRLAIATV